MRELLSKARARVIRHLVLDKGALALAIGMGGLILLLLAGTQVLDWYWPVLLASISLGVGIYQLRRHVPSRYQLAQRIDHRMELADSLSTAVYFSENPRPGLEAVCAAQFRAADGLADTVVLEHALPMARSRYLLPAITLLAVASGLFVVRYLVMGSLDMNGSLVEMAVDTFFTSPAEVAATKGARPDLRPRPFDPSQPDVPPEEAQLAIPPDAEKGKELASDAQDQEAANNDKSADEQSDKDGSEDSKKGGSPDDKSKQDKQNGREGDDKGSNDLQGQDQRSMLDKLRDAVNNLVNKVSSNEAKQQNAKSDAKQKGQKSDKAGKADDSADQDSQADAQNSDDPGGKGKPNPEQAKSKSQEAGEKGASGNGENEGKKDVEEAKAEEAMGKVSELLTLRSASVSGDMMVEVGTTDQQLKTAMTQQKAGHTDPGGEIHRDQVPLADQPFVERYFQEIRKPANTAPPKAKSK